MTPCPLPLTRTAAFVDFRDCDSVAVWQQCLAIEAYQRWGRLPAQTPDYGEILCYNWGAAHFRAPGLAPIYLGYGDTGIEPDCLSAVFALSVLDRVDAPLRFLRRVVNHLLPGGLVVCTFAAWDITGEDCAVGCKQRQRIYDHGSWRKLLHETRILGLASFGGVDLRYHGDTCGDHTLATLVATKGRSESWRKSV